MTQIIINYVELGKGWLSLPQLGAPWPPHSHHQGC